MQENVRVTCCVHSLFIWISLFCAFDLVRDSFFFVIVCCALVLF